MIGHCAATSASGIDAVSKGKGRGDNNEAHGLVEDYGLKCAEAKQSNQEGQTEFRTAKADQTTDNADQRPSTKNRKFVLAHIELLMPPQGPLLHCRLRRTS